MKSFRFWLVLLSLPLLWAACKESVKPDEPGPTLKTIIELRYTPDDSLMVTYRFDQNGRSVSEEYGGRYAPAAIIDLYNPKDLPAPSNTTIRYRLHSYNAQNQEISVKQYFAQFGSRWSVFNSDTLIYVANQLVRQEHKDYYFIVDGTGYAFYFPLWLTKRTVAYDSQKRIESETDSVFITHDMPAGTVVLAKAPANYMHTNKATYEYNAKGELTRTTAASNNGNKLLTYSNGWGILNTEGKGYAASFRMRFTPGVTTYAYEYNADRQLSRRVATYNDGKNAQNYVSTFIYAYK